jgi:hypothetical protein
VEGMSSFNSTLHNEFFIVFPVAENLTPSNSTSIVDVAQEDVWTANPESKVENTLSAATSPVLGTLTMIVPRYGNRQKSLDELAIKVLASNLQGAADEFVNLRNNALASAQEESAGSSVPLKFPTIQLAHGGINA